MLNKILKQKAFLSFLFVALVIGGIMSYSSMGKLEDPEIPVKAAVVVTVYPGASAQEVETEVTDVLEKAIQRLDNIDNIQSRSMPGYSEITVNIKKGFESFKLPQLWDNLRRKVNDVKGDLPQGAYTPIVNDDFGDVSGIFLAMAEFMPTLGVQVSYGYNYVPNLYNGGWNTIASAQLSVPIVHWGEKRQKLKAARYKLEQSKLKQDDARELMANRLCSLFG